MQAKKLCGRYLRNSSYLNYILLGKLWKYTGHFITFRRPEYNVPIAKFGYLIGLKMKT
jgi:hypothetical protein